MLFAFGRLIMIPKSIYNDFSVQSTFEGSGTPRPILMGMTRVVNQHNRALIIIFQFIGRTDNTNRPNN